MGAQMNSVAKVIPSSHLFMYSWTTYLKISISFVLSKKDFVLSKHKGVNMRLRILNPISMIKSLAEANREV